MCLANFDRDMGVRFNDDRIGAKVVLLGYFLGVVLVKDFGDVAFDHERMALPNFLGFLANDFQMAVFADFFHVVFINHFAAVVFDVFLLVALDDEVAVLADPFQAIALNADVLVFFAVNENLFLAFLILEANLVEASATLAAVGFKGANRFLAREWIRNGVLRIVNAASDDRLVGIAFEKLDDYF